MLQTLSPKGLLIHVIRRQITDIALLGLLEELALCECAARFPQGGFCGRKWHFQAWNWVGGRATDSPSTRSVSLTPTAASSVPFSTATSAHQDQTALTTRGQTSTVIGANEVNILALSTFSYSRRVGAGACIHSDDGHCSRQWLRAGTVGSIVAIPPPFDAQYCEPSLIPGNRLRLDLSTFAPNLSNFLLCDLAGLT